MDVFRATSDYVPPQGYIGVLPLKEGDFFEVLESENYRYHKDWWGVRRTGDNAIGYVPAKFIKFEETRPEDVLPDDYLEQREMYVRQLHEMEKTNEPNLPDLYKMPPLTTKSYDDWREDYRNGPSGATGVPPPDYDINRCHQSIRSQQLLPQHCDTHAPYPDRSSPFLNDDPAADLQPDYSDDDDDDDYPSGDDRNGLAPPGDKTDGNALSEDDWAKIIASADMELGEAPVSPEPDLPEPDYQDEDWDIDTQDNAKYKYKVILPAPEIGAQLGGDGSGAGEIKPKKLVNPVLQSKEHQLLHREMKMNQKLGVDVLNQKSELRKEFDSRQIRQAEKEKAKEIKANKNPFQLKLEEQAEKLRLYEESQNPSSDVEREDSSPVPGSSKSPTSPKTAPKPAKTDQNQNQSEFLRVHSKIIRTKTS